MTSLPTGPDLSGPIADLEASVTEIAALLERPWAGVAELTAVLGGEPLEGSISFPSGEEMREVRDAHRVLVQRVTGQAGPLARLRALAPSAGPALVLLETLLSVSDPWFARPGSAEVPGSTLRRAMADVRAVVQPPAEAPPVVLVAPVADEPSVLTDEPPIDEVLVLVALDEGGVTLAGRPVFTRHDARLKEDSEDARRLFALADGAEVKMTPQVARKLSIVTTEALKNTGSGFRVMVDGPDRKEPGVAYLKAVARGKVVRLVRG